MNILDAIAIAKHYVDGPTGDRELAAYTLRDLPEVKAAGLHDLARLLASGEYGCSKNDVLVLIENLEKWIKGGKE